MPFLTYHDGDQVQRFEITRKLTGVGRAGDNDLAISDPGIEPYHAQILRDGKSWVLTSLDPEAVLLVNGRDRRNYGLRDGDLLMMGGTELSFSLSAPQEAKATPRQDTGRRRAVDADGLDPRLKKISTFAEQLLLGMEVPEIFKTLLDHVEFAGKALHSDDILEHVHKTPVVCDLRVGLAIEKMLKQNPNKEPWMVALGFGIGTLTSLGIFALSTEIVK